MRSHESEHGKTRQQPTSYAGSALSRTQRSSTIVLTVLAVENPAVRVRIPAKLFRQLRALPSTSCECAASGKSTSIPELRRHTPWRWQRTRLAVRPCRKRTRFRFRMMLRMEHTFVIGVPRRASLALLQTRWEVSTFEQTGRVFP